MTQTEAKIFLSERRGITQFEWFRSFHTFNFGNYFDENKLAFGAIKVFNENTLAPEKSMKMQVEAPTEILILPIVGDIEFKNCWDRQCFGRVCAYTYGLCEGLM